MCTWFVALAALGLFEIAANPSVLRAVNPIHAIAFVEATPRIAFLALGAVVLAVTGTEALYADMGHFGAAPIRRAWICIRDAGARRSTTSARARCCSADPTAIKNPFYLLAPQWALIPLVILATCAAVIASQAVISGAFSLTRAAIQMGYCPRLKLLHTSEREIGQIYVPFVNWTLLDRSVAARARVPELGQPGRRVRHRGDARDADRLGADLRRHAPALGLVAAASRSRSRCRSSRSTSRSCRRTRSRSPTAAGSRSSSVPSCSRCSPRGSAAARC